MAQRTTIYLEPKLYRALKVKAALTDRPISALVNEAVESSLREDALDAQAVRKRAKEPSRLFSTVLKELKRQGLL